MKQITMVAIVLIAVTGIVCFAGGWQYRQGEVDTAYEAGMQYQSGLDEEAVSAVASIKFTLNSTSIDHSDTVGADGSVTTTTTVTRTIWVNNTDETRSATDLKISLLNSVTGTEGLHNGLEQDDTDVYVVTSAGVTDRLYLDGDYTTGVDIPDLGPGSSFTMTLTFELEDAVAGTYQNGQTYDCSLYLIQTSANYADVEDFTVLT
jgi:hypothetical protein